MLSVLIAAWIGSSIPTAACVIDSLPHIERCGVGLIAFFVLLDLTIKACAVLGYLKFLGVL